MVHDGHRTVLLWRAARRRRGVRVVLPVHVQHAGVHRIAAVHVRASAGAEVRLVALRRDDPCPLEVVLKIDPELTEAAVRLRGSLLHAVFRVEALSSEDRPLAATTSPLVVLALLGPSHDQEVREVLVLVLLVLLVFLVPGRLDNVVGVTVAAPATPSLLPTPLLTDLFLLIGFFF